MSAPAEAGCEPMRALSAAVLPNAVQPPDSLSPCAAGQTWDLGLLARPTWDMGLLALLRQIEAGPTPLPLCKTAGWLPPTFLQPGGTNHVDVRTPLARLPVAPGNGFGALRKFLLTLSWENRALQSTAAEEILLAPFSWSTSTDTLFSEVLGTAHRA